MAQPPTTYDGSPSHQQSAPRSAPDHHQAMEDRVRTRCGHRTGGFLATQWTIGKWFCSKNMVDIPPNRSNRPPKFQCFISMFRMMIMAYNGYFDGDSPFLETQKWWIMKKTSSGTVPPQKARMYYSWNSYTRTGCKTENRHVQEWYIP